jgi:hypothetical protein
VPNPENVNIQKYKSLLLDKLEDTLEITGFNVVDLIRTATKNTTNKFRSVL